MTDAEFDEDEFERVEVDFGLLRMRAQLLLLVDDIDAPEVAWDMPPLHAAALKAAEKMIDLINAIDEIDAISRAVFLVDPECGRAIKRCEEAANLLRGRLRRTRVEDLYNMLKDEQEQSKQELKCDPRMLEAMEEISRIQGFIEEHQMKRSSNDSRSASS